MIISKIVKNDLCVGCGLCASVLGKDNCRMELNKEGFYRPIVSHGSDRTVKKFCPGIVINFRHTETIWGNVVEVYEGWSTDNTLRHKAASGGAVSSMAIFMIESGKADAVLQVGVQENSYLFNELKISRTREDIINNAQSRYAPVATLQNILEILDSSKDRYVFIGKPCDIAGIKNLFVLYPQYTSRFVLFISIFCAGTPSYNATEDVWKMSGRTTSPIRLKYRGEGWPGDFQAKWEDGFEYCLSYNESWGKVLGRQLGYRCKICPDGVGMLADISVGDAWHTKNGYPDFSDADGRSFIMIRTQNGAELVTEATSNNYLESSKIPIHGIRNMQPYQYDRREMAFWRYLPAKIVTCGLVRFKGLNSFKYVNHLNIKKGFKEMLGSFKRMLKKRKKND